jgi:hypothetical protein
LTEVVGGADKVLENHYLEGPLTSARLYVPSKQLAVELATPNHYYPYASKLNNVQMLRSKLMRQHNQRTCYINSKNFEKFTENNSEILKAILDRSVNGKKEEDV